MTPAEFVRLCQLCGYASKKLATKYALEKDGELLDADFQAIFQLNERKNDLKNAGHKTHGGTVNSEKLLDKLSDTPRPWNHIFDSRER